MCERRLYHAAHRVLDFMLFRPHRAADEWTRRSRDRPEFLKFRDGMVRPDIAAHFRALVNGRRVFDGLA